MAGTLSRKDGLGLIGDLISMGAVAPVVSLSQLHALRARASARDPLPDHLRELLAHYCLEDRETRAAFDVIVSGLGRRAGAGDAFHVQGVPGSGKSHLLSVVALLAGSPDAAWPAFCETHPEVAKYAAAFERFRLVAAIALDEYPTPSHSLEYVVFHRLEEEVERICGRRVALTEESHIVELVETYVRPQTAGKLDHHARQETGSTWEELRDTDPPRAAATALEFVEREGFPLDWRRSRAEAWSKLQEALASATTGSETAAWAPDGVVVILDELGVFLASKDRPGLNADASFLQWLAQRTATSRYWLICATQRGMEEVGDIDRRTLRQVRDRFRAGFTLDLSELEWVVRHKIAPRRDEHAFRTAMAELADGSLAAAGEELLSAEALGAAYPVNPACLRALRRAAETHLSRTRSAAKLLRETLKEGGWLQLPADRLITLDVVFDVFRDEMGMSEAGRRQLHAFDVVMGNAARIARGEEARVARVMKALCVLGLGEVRWSERELRQGFVGCEDEDLWRDPEVLRGTVRAIHQRGAYVERARGDAAEGDSFYVDVSSDVSAQVRERLNELVSELHAGDARVLQAALGACRDASFPLAALAQPQRVAVMWLRARRHVEALCCDLKEFQGGELVNRLAALAAPAAREDGLLFVASPLTETAVQDMAWRTVAAGADGRFASSTVAWMPGPLNAVALEHLVEHAALTLMLTDKTLFGRRGSHFRERVRERWSASEEEVRRLLHRAYYDGHLLAADGREPIPAEQLSGLFGDWEGTLAAIFSEPFRTLFPRFAQVAPARPLTSRVQTHPIVEQFILPGQATLSPMSALEAHLEAYAEPLGLVDGTGPERRLALKHTELVEAALAATPERSASEEVDPSEVVAFGELAGRLCKSEWGLTREQAELLLAALIRTGHLVALDAFVQPLRLDQVRTPLDEGIQYVMRGRPLADEMAEKANGLWEAASGQPPVTWDLPTQERAWGFFVRWAQEFSAEGTARAEAITRAAVALRHDPTSWDWAREALSTTEAVARAVDSSLTSREGLAALLWAVDRLPGGNQQTRERLTTWQTCERFLSGEIESLARVRNLLVKGVIPEKEPLARDRDSVLARFADSRGIVCAPAEVKAAGERWLERYRKHYLAWHERVHAAARFEALVEVRRSAEMETMRRLARAGLHAAEAEKIEAEVGAALTRRCLAGDPLPAGHVVCPICEVRFKEEVALPEVEEVGERTAGVVARQLEALRCQADMLHRRLGVCGIERVREGVQSLLGTVDGEPGALATSLTDEVVTWLREQLGQPKARRRQVADLVTRLQGKELTKQDVLRIVQEWLGEEEGFVEVV